MDTDRTWAAIDHQRRVTADLLDGLTPAQWAHPSLCDGWTVRDVAAHLTLQELGVGDLLRMALAHPTYLGGLNRTIRLSARERARRPTPELVADLRALVGSRRHNVGVTPHEALMDVTVHGQDVAVPLGLDLDLPVDVAAAVAARAWSYGNRGKARVLRHLPLEGLRLTATDTEWAAGQGQEVHGPIRALLLLVTGRDAAVDLVEGPGADLLRARHTAA